MDCESPTQPLTGQTAAPGSLKSEASAPSARFGVPRTGKRKGMVSRALLEGMLGGLRYPATPQELADELRDLGDDGAALAMLARLSRIRYASANDVCEELFPVEPNGAGISSR